jgi:hypothetical protein
MSPLKNGAKKARKEKSTKPPARATRTVKEREVNGSTPTPDIPIAATKVWTYANEQPLEEFHHHDRKKLQMILLDKVYGYVKFFRNNKQIVDSGYLAFIFQWMMWGDYKDADSGELISNSFVRCRHWVCTLKEIQIIMGEQRQYSMTQFGLQWKGKSRHNW